MNYAIDQYEFAFWDGPPPSVPTRKVLASTRPGTDGVSHHLLGTWADPFEVVLTSHFTNQLLAAAAHSLMLPLIGADPVSVIYNAMAWSSLHGVRYTVMSIELLDIRSSIWLVGPSYAYYHGASLITRWQLQGQEV